MILDCLKDRMVFVKVNIPFQQVPTIMRYFIRAEIVLDPEWSSIANEVFNSKSW